MATVNGRAENIAGITLGEYLARAGYLPERVVVERNLEIVPRSMLGSTVIRDGDSIEILQFVGGG
ncbi:MAG: sulfur carrier protein ThiS [Oscillospiraceae bacterium]|nr:sulfur carrier protein ThiS [Oscillospiraceae bacterium]